MSSSIPQIACILVNYRSPWDMLKSCLESISASTGASVRVTIVDNGSGDGVLDQVRKTFPATNIIELGRNAGFAAAVNRGLAEVEEPYVLLLNTDAMLTPDAARIMAQALDEAGDDIAGVAPKMMSSTHEGIIDAIGTVMPRWGAPYNRGIGQCDLGQYDRREEVAGVCFGATLIRRSLFDPQEVGPLYENYFLYFEDADWCMRATSQGYRFLTVPKAEVLHMHSGVTRHESLEFKYRLIELNTLKMVTRTFGNARGAARVVAARTYRLLARTFIRRRFIRANLATIAAYLSALPRLLAERRQLKTRRITSDQKIFAMAEGEHAYFNTVNYAPDRCLESLIDTYQRLLKQERAPEAGKVLTALYKIEMEASGGKTPALAGEMKELFSSQPTCVRALLETEGLTGI